jgi:hypothetical protein
LGLIRSYSLALPEKEENKRSKHWRHGRTWRVQSSLCFILLCVAPTEVNAEERYINLGQLIEDAFLLRYWSVEDLNGANNASGPDVPPPADELAATAVFRRSSDSQTEAEIESPSCNSFSIGSYDDWRKLGAARGVIDSWSIWNKPVAGELIFNSDMKGYLESAKAIVAAKNGAIDIADILTDQGEIQGALKTRLLSVTGFKYDHLLHDLESFRISNTRQIDCGDFTIYKIEVTKND